MSTGIEKEIGNTLIRYNDRWRGPCYLTDNLSFTTDRAQAARFYLLKSSDTMILNGDRISFNHGNRTIMITEHNKLVLRDRELINREISTFVITNGSDSTEPIAYDVPLFIIASTSTPEHELGLCYANPGFHTPAMLNVAPIDAEFIHTFRFYLERTDSTITNRIAVNNNNKKYDESYRNAVIIALLLIVLVLTMIVNK